MSWLFGAGMGFLRGGPLGAIIGGAIQHFITKKLEGNIRRNLPGVVDQPVCVVAVTAIMTKLSMAKGYMTEGEAFAIHRFFAKNLEYSKKDLNHIDEIIRETLRMDPDLKSLVEQYQKASHYKLLLLALGYQVGLVGGLQETQERINQLSEYLGISYEDHDRIREKYSLGALKTPYTVLGIKSTASNEEIKKAYRSLVALYHPDKVAHLGEDCLEDAHIRFLEIQSAYRELESKKT